MNCWVKATGNHFKTLVNFLLKHTQWHLQSHCKAIRQIVLINEQDSRKVLHKNNAMNLKNTEYWTFTNFQYLFHLL